MYNDENVTDFIISQAALTKHTVNKSCKVSRCGFYATWVGWCLPEVMTLALTH